MAVISLNKPVQQFCEQATEVFYQNKAGLDAKTRECIDEMLARQDARLRKNAYAVYTAKRRRTTLTLEEMSEIVQVAGANVFTSKPPKEKKGFLRQLTGIVKEAYTVITGGLTKREYACLLEAISLGEEEKAIQARIAAKKSIATRVTAPLAAHYFALEKVVEEELSQRKVAIFARQYSKNMYACLTDPTADFRDVIEINNYYAGLLISRIKEQHDTRSKRLPLSTMRGGNVAVEMVAALVRVSDYAIASVTGEQREEIQGEDVQEKIRAAFTEEIQLIRKSTGVYYSIKASQAALGDIEELFTTDEATRLTERQRTNFDQIHALREKENEFASHAEARVRRAIATKRESTLIQSVYATLGWTDENQPEKYSSLLTETVNERIKEVKEEGFLGRLFSRKQEQREKPKEPAEELAEPYFRKFYEGSLALVQSGLRTVYKVGLAAAALTAIGVLGTVGLDHYTKHQKPQEAMADVEEQGEGRTSDEIQKIMKDLRRTASTASSPAKRITRYQPAAYATSVDQLTVEIDETEREQTRDSIRYDGEPIPVAPKTQAGGYQRAVQGFPVQSFRAVRHTLHLYEGGTDKGGMSIPDGRGGFIAPEHWQSLNPYSRRAEVTTRTQRPLHTSSALPNMIPI